MGASVSSVGPQSRPRRFCHSCRSWLPLAEEGSEPSLQCPHCSSEFVEEMPAPMSQPSGTSSALRLNNHFITQILNAHNMDGPRAGLLALMLAAEAEVAIVNEAISRSLAEAAKNAKTPTAAHIIKSLPIVEVDQALTEVVCAVCSEQFKTKERAKKLPCHHLYHPDCIDPWLGTTNTCPMCRHELPTEEKPPPPPPPPITAMGRMGRPRMMAQSRAFRSNVPPPIFTDEDSEGLTFRGVERSFAPSSSSAMMSSSTSVLSPSSSSSPSSPSSSTPLLQSAPPRSSSSSLAAGGLPPLDGAGLVRSTGTGTTSSSSSSSLSSSRIAPSSSARSSAIAPTTSTSSSARGAAGSSSVASPSRMPPPRGNPPVVSSPSSSSAAGGAGVLSSSSSSPSSGSTPRRTAGSTGIMNLTRTASSNASLISRTPATSSRTGSSPNLHRSQTEDV